VTDIRIKDLPLNGAPNANQFVATDLTSTEKLTIQSLVDTGAPIASQAEAEAGVNATKRMTPLTTKQAIDQFLVLSTDRVSLSSYGAAGDGTTDDTAAINAAFSSGSRLTGNGLTYAVTGKISLLANNSLWDATFKQLAPGASLSVITLEGDTISGLDLRRVKVDRNGDGTNGGLLDASGTNGALATAFGMKFISCSSSHFEDLEVYGDDSGTGILFRSIGETSRIIRPYAHDMVWRRAAATDDQLQGVWFDQCTNVDIDATRVINLTGVLGGVATKRFTRGNGWGGCTAVRSINSYVERCDQGIDVTGGPLTNTDCRIVNPVVKDCFVYGLKLANTARRTVISGGIAYGCGVGFVESANAALAAGTTTDRNIFVDCIAFNSGATGQTVVSVAGFRSLASGGTEVGSAARARYIRCRAIDEQTVKTMTYGFNSEVADPSYAPILDDCESIGHITAAKTGIYKTPASFGTVSQNGGYQTGDIIERGSDANGQYVRYADGTQHCWTIFDDSAAAWTTADGAAFVRATSLTFTFAKVFSANPTVTATSRRGVAGLALGASINDIATNAVTITPYCFTAIGAGNAKSVHIHAVGRWY